MIGSRISSKLALASVLVLAGIGAADPGHAAPANDHFADAKTIPSVPFVDDFSTIGATIEAGEPDPATVCASGAASVWYRYTPPTAGRFVANTVGSSFGAYVGVYRGNSLGGLSLAACDSEIYLEVPAGETLSIQIGGSTLDTDGNIVPEAGDVHLDVRLFEPCPGCASFTNEAVPRDRFNFAAGETSIGVNPETNSTFFQMGRHTLRARWDAGGVATWQEVGDITTSQLTFDPILWTDPTTGRTYVVQLLGAGSVVAYTDDDGATWTRTEPASVLPSFDHETIGGGPYPEPLRGKNPVYPNAVYYCAQFAISQCARSDDGGLTWGPALTMNALKGCAGLHGHIVVASDGTVLVPHGSCGSSAAGGQGVIASTDMGVSWALRRVPGTRSNRGDPGIAFDAAGRLYFAAASGGRAVVATSDDNGVSWTKPVEVSAPFGIRNTTFPMVVAGDGGRAAVAFYGSRQFGSDQSSEFTGEWHVYVAMTYDGGKSWDTMDVTPNDPVQRGCIWLGGGGNPCRNLLDFQGMTMDAYGRVLVGYADGCTSPECLAPTGTPKDSRSSAGVIARQTSGKGLVAEYDGTL